MEAYEAAIGRAAELAQYDPNCIDQLIDIGKAHLNNSNGRKFVRNTLDNLGSLKDFEGGTLKEYAKKGFQKIL